MKNLNRREKSTMTKLLIFIFAVVVEIFCIIVYRKSKTNFALGIVLLQGLNVLWGFARVLGLVP
jgi:hypothetical protein